RSPVLPIRVCQHGMRETPTLFAATRQLDLPLGPIMCGGPRRTFQERERWSSGCNFVAVRPGVILAYSRNENTYRELEREAGYRIVDAIELLTGETDTGDEQNAAIGLEGTEPVRGRGRHR